MSKINVDLLRTKIATMLYVPDDLVHVTENGHTSFQEDVTLVRAILEVWYDSMGVIRYPANWKEAFKERWFPLWAKKRWPIEYQCYTAAMAYPHFSPHDSLGPAFKVMIPDGLSVFDIRSRNDNPKP